MELLASYDDDTNGENSMSASPKTSEMKPASNLSSQRLENEWLSFQQMISPGTSEPMNSSDFLVNGIVAYPGMKGSGNSMQGSIDVAMEEQSANTDPADEFTESKDEKEDDEHDKDGEEDDDDAFFRMRKQVKERDRSSSSSRSGSSGSSSRSSSRSGSPSPPHLSPVTSVKSHTSEPPDITESDMPETEVVDVPLEEKVVAETLVEEKPRSKSKDRKRTRSRERKRSHREHRSKHEHGSRSKHRRSGSRTRDRDRKRRRSRDRHHHKKSRDKRSRSKERKESTSDVRKSEGRDQKDSAKSDSRKSGERDGKSGMSDQKLGSGDQKSEGRDRRDSAASGTKLSESDKTEVKTEGGNNKDTEGNRKHSRSGSRDRKDRKDRKRSRSRHRHRSRSKDRKERRKSKERKRSRSKDRKKKHKSRSRSKDRRSKSRHRSRDRHSRSRSRERLRSRSPVPGRKLTFKEQMRKEFISASKEITQDKVATGLDSLRRPGESLRPSDLLKGVKLNSGESVTPQMALMQTMAAMHKKAQELTGVEVPKYYNPAAVNPLKYAEQVQKRKLLWSKKPEEKDKTKNEQMETQWKSAFASSDDTKAATKFRKLMGMKDGDDITLENLPEEFQKLTEEQKRKQAELFQRLDQEYQFARMTTHTQRGVGLGFASTVIDPNHPQQKPP